jgi:hypothetical protein
MKKWLLVLVAAVMVGGCTDKESEAIKLNGNRYEWTISMNDDEGTLIFSRYDKVAERTDMTTFMPEM